MRQQRKNKESRPKEFIDVQTENKRGNLAVFLTVMILLTP